MCRREKNGGFRNRETKSQPSKFVCDMLAALSVCVKLSKALQGQFQSRYQKSRPE